MRARRVAFRSLAGLCVAASAVTATGVAAPFVAGGQEASEEVIELPDSFLEGFGWWNKAQQNPAGGQNPNVPVPLPVGTNCVPTDVNACPVGPPPDGIYVVYDYEAVAPTVVTGPVSNAPVPALPPAPPGAPLPNPSTPQVLGPTAYGAVKYVVPEGAETQLALRILSRNTTQPGGTDPSIGKVFACIVTTPGWAAIQNGRYDQGPDYDCTTADEGDVQGDVVVFDLGTQFVQNGAIDVAVVGAGDRPFQLALAAPSDQDLTVLSAPDSGLSEELPEDFTFEDPAAEFAAEDTFITTVEDFGTADLAVGEFSVDDSFGAVAAPPVARPRATLRQTAQPSAAVLNPFRPDASRGERMMAVAVLLLLAAALWWVGGQPVRAPRLLGSLGAGTPVDVPLERDVSSRGIGRFARPRSGDGAPRLF